MQTIRFGLILFLMLSTFHTSARIILVPDEISTIQSAIDLAATGDEVVVRDGVYEGEGFRDIRFSGKAIIVRSEHGREFCTIKGPEDNSLYRAFIFNQNETLDSVLMGFRIIDFQSTNLNGAAILISESSATVIDCEFSNNRAGSAGGAIYAHDASIHLISSNFKNNLGGFDGGALGTWQTTGSIEDCVFDSNVSDAVWGGFDVYGGAIGAWSSSLRIINCLIVNNIARGDDHVGFDALGGGIFIENSNQTEPNLLINCTIYGNRIEQAGFYDGICAGAGSIEMKNCIIWNNNSNHYGENSDIQYCVLPEELTGAGNLHIDPQFKLPENGFYYLLPTSPCIDSGYADSSEICFDASESEICLDALFCVVGDSPDSGISDRGYHYADAFSQPSTATPTPGPSCTPSPPQTPTPNPELQVMIYMPSHQFSEGNLCQCLVTINNPNSHPLVGYPLFVILDLLGNYYFAPSFSTQIDSYLDAYPAIPSGETGVNVLQPFLWPANTGSMTGAFFHAALTNPSVTQIYGRGDSWEFGWKD